MDALFHVNWHQLLVPKLSLLEIVLRGVVIYVGLCLLLRVVLKRQAGKVSLSDLLVITLVAGVCRNPLVADAYSVPDGLGVVAVVLLSSYAADWLSYHSPLVHKLMHPPRVELIRDGVIMHDSLRRELMTENQLRCQLRQKGMADPADVAEAWIEGSGEISVVPKKDTAVEDALRRQAAELAELRAALERWGVRANGSTSGRVS
ncbi:MAG TPA: YetF domain-containing protein [Gemmataceae bacterium]